MTSRATVSMFVLAAAALLGGAASAEPASTNYTSIEARGDKPVQIGYYAAANKTCAPAELPVVRVVTPPSSGLFIVKRATLTTDKVAGCPRLQVPAQVGFYQARGGVTGSDHLVFEVRFATGEVASYDVTVTIKEPEPAKPAEGVIGKDKI
jgi:hypothetical protein